jgi:hypothetical protein
MRILHASRLFCCLLMPLSLFADELNGRIELSAPMQAQRLGMRNIFLRRSDSFHLYS